MELGVKERDCNSGMKLLVDCVPLSQGGGVQVAIALLLNLGRCVDICWRAVVPKKLLPHLPSQLREDPRIIFLRKESRLDFLRLRWRLQRIEQAFQPDVVYTVFGPAFFRARARHVIGFALPNLVYPRVGSTGKSSPAIIFTDWLRCILLRQADTLVVETETVARLLAEKLHIDAKGIVVIGNSLNPLLRDYLPKSVETDDPFIIFVPSAYYRHKNLEIIPRIAASMRVLDKELRFVFKLTLPLESSPWKAIAAEALALEMGDSVISLGVLQLLQMAEEYQKASIVFLPTLREVSTAVYPEAFYFMKPLVTSDLEFARELCADAACFVAPDDAEDSARAIVKLLRSSEARQRLAEVGANQLRKMYPTSEEKFAMQLKLLGLDQRTNVPPSLAS
jgi:glycosyltransferase involved in cell wall biosynthesis